jgi:hypothetical protein
MKKDKIKIIHASDLKSWTRFPEYRDYDGLTLGEYHKRKKTADKYASRYLQPLLFISHRWDAKDHPDPEGRQLTKLQLLEDCFLIYDYTSFPQNTTSPEDEAALLEILLGMNALISKVLVLAAPDFLERGWCIYEYIVASMRASVVCDELNDPNFVRLRNLSATNPPVSLKISGHSIESGIQNAKNDRMLETVNAILPLFDQAKFTVERDREIVRDLLVSELVRLLPGKMEYIPYAGEWKTISWTKEELQEAFSSELKWESPQQFKYFKPIELTVPSTVAEAVRKGYRLDRTVYQDKMTGVILILADLAWVHLVDWGIFLEDLMLLFGGFFKGLVKGFLICKLSVEVIILLFAIVCLFFVLKSGGIMELLNVF